ncbi:uncharacterized protein F5891DRAFT_1189347 [Suillus fuscotomentosus]|uniref:Uncharacterized protein n=1 Tax=Suillus fuscotomentosus TaxID=1912939 RepID=A0AAD4E531_9AGAM|nr:uncharacterized protein F5891DRAFT_1189347 [Suillus fuscotomentosus]KAG1899875.1 hypothetical protein F5891DRAFT_1189347 [Suillus fuscotomentosus]
MSSKSQMSPKSSKSPKLPRLNSRTLKFSHGLLSLHFYPKHFNVHQVQPFALYFEADVINAITRFILGQTISLKEYDDNNPLSSSLQSDSQNRLLHIACYPPFHLLHTASLESQMFHFLSALSGPSSDVFIHSNVERIGTDVDDTVTDAHIDTLLGLTQDNSLLWPPLDLFDKYMEWEGEWTASLEAWFMRHIAAIQDRDSRAFATCSQWTARLCQRTTSSSKDTSRVVTEAQAELLCFDIDKLDPKSFAALD